MPEGGEVKTFSDSLNRVLKGKKLLSLKKDSKSRYTDKKTGKNTLANLDELEDALPLTIKRVWSKGKKIIFDLGDISLVSSLGLEGKWIPSSLSQDHSNLWLTYKDENGKKKRIYYDDVRHMGSLEIILTKDALETRLDKIGQDLLSDPPSKKAWLKMYRQKSLRDKEICKVIMEQKYFSGVGNYIKAMSLYKARIRPDALISELEDEHLLTLRKYVLKIIRESYEARGATLRTYKDFEGKRGKFEVECYGQKKDKKGRKIIVVVHADGRNTYMCPSRQIIPSPYEPPKLDKKKLKRSYSRGADTYKVTELRGFCKQYGVGQSGNKEELVTRLLKVV